MVEVPLSPAFSGFKVQKLPPVEFCGVSIIWSVAARLADAQVFPFPEVSVPNAALFLNSKKKPLLPYVPAYFIAFHWLVSSSVSAKSAAVKIYLCLSLVNAFGAFYATKVDYIPNGAMYGHILLAILPLVAMYLVLNNMIEITTKSE